MIRTVLFFYQMGILLKVLIGIGVLAICLVIAFAVYHVIQLKSALGPTSISATPFV